MKAVERFLKYVTVDTQSDEGSGASPSTEKQKNLGAMLADELAALGLENPHMDEFGYVYGWLPASPGCEDVPCLGLIAHMDTAPAVSGAGVAPRVVRYEGGDLVLNEALGVALRPDAFESLARYVGQDLIVTDGTTLLGADDKAGVAEIITALELLIANPALRHGRIAVAFTPDEEIGHGTRHFNVEKFGAAAAYTVDGGELGQLEYESFNAAAAKVTVRGLNIHPGTAKNKMKNALLIAMEFAAMLPPAETPAHTEGREGFYHLSAMQGNETAAQLSYIIRDHDRARFHARKAHLARVAAYLNETHGADTVELTVSDQYFNMREVLEHHMDLVTRARAAFAAEGISSVEVPIRGGTDGSRLSFMGLPCPNLSTGGMNFHSIHECIPAAALDTMAQVLVRLVCVTRSATIGAQGE